MIFAEYGTEVVNDWILPASSANLRGTQSQSLPFSKILSKYYIGRNNISCGISADLTDIKRTGGSAACFMGTLPFQELHNFWDGYEKTRTLIPQEDSSLLQQPVGFGVGLVTEEAWKHPEVPGSATVAYHEGCGHAINMPHPTRRHPKGVMSVAQYHGTHLSQHHIAWEILKHMWSKRISSSLSGVSKADMLLNDPCNPLNALNLDDCEDCQEDRMESERLRKEEEYKILLYQVITGLSDRIENGSCILRRFLKFTKTIVLVNEELEEPTVLSVPTQVANNSETCWVYSSFDSTDGAGYLCRNLDSVLIVKKDEGLLRLMVAPRVTWMEAQFGCSTDIKEPTLPEESEESFNVVEQAIATKIKERLHRSVPVYGNSLYQFEEIRSAWLSQYVSTLQGTNARDTDSYMPVLLQDKARGLQLRLPPYSPQNSLSISSSASLNVDVAYRHSQFAHIRPYHDEDNSAEEFNGDNAYSTRFEEIWTDHLLSSLGITVSSLVASISEATSKVKAADMDVTLQAIRDTTTRVTIGVAKKTKSLTCFLNSMKIERSHEWGLSVEQEELMPTQEHDFQQFRRGVWMEHE